MEGSFEQWVSDLSSRGLQTEGGPFSPSSYRRRLAECPLLPIYCGSCDHIKEEGVELELLYFTFGPDMQQYAFTRCSSCLISYIYTVGELVEKLG